MVYLRLQMHCSPSGGQIGIGKSKITGRNSHSSMSAVNKKEKKKIHHFLPTLNKQVYVIKEN